ncbi:hypothetical protein TK06_20905 [Pseudomonas fluorescens]|uniref:Uncharacterized protein n=1 Tax=Pseudomonas fluorescens TaxID=294 RepID=A0A161H8S5_PSEFL|nr:hypothetical protein TK06_20905 [Pseudomonas fluorescens]
MKARSFDFQVKNLGSQDANIFTKGFNFWTTGQYIFTYSMDYPGARFWYFLKNNRRVCSYERNAILVM